MPFHEGLKAEAGHRRSVIRARVCSRYEVAAHLIVTFGRNLDSERTSLS